MKLEFINEADTLDWVGSDYKQGMARYNADTSFRRGGITYFIEFLDPFGSNMLAKWWDNSDNGVGYNNQGYVFVDNQFNRMTGYFSPENIDKYIRVDSDYGRKPPLPIQRIIINKVKKQLDYDALNDIKRIGESAEVNESVKRISVDELKIGDKINGHEKGWLTVTDIKKGKFGKSGGYVSVTVDTANGEKVLEYPQYSFNKEYVDVVRFNESTLRRTMKESSNRHPNIPDDRNIRALRKAVDYINKFIDDEGIFLPDVLDKSSETYWQLKDYVKSDWNLDVDEIISDWTDDSYFDVDIRDKDANSDLWDPRDYIFNVLRFVCGVPYEKAEKMLNL